MKNELVVHNYYVGLQLAGSIIGLKYLTVDAFLPTQILQAFREKVGRTFPVIRTTEPKIP